MGTFDPMAVAIDWLDAYCANDLHGILGLYDDQAQLECGCNGQTVIAGKAAIAEYWRLRFREAPALELEDLEVEGEFIKLAYKTGDGVVNVVFEYTASGKIALSRCGPTLN